ncbi:MAG: hypothetical protein COV67_05665 [Nitrospinae bacterium CG11_big_fil_rev_8_21_14_0_20_56_8]|nr:MAG: hypothetical protein COV67_05665 [Nitrospinae bacterium CG11_big_fil_rev_8_21_14_0_20_56_8]
MRIAILQPSYLPWLGYFEQMARVDRFVFLDDVQYTRRDWRNRNRVRTREGWCWLTVPVIQKNRYRQLLKETRIDPSMPWRRKHLETLRANYAHAPYFDLYFPRLESIYNKDPVFLVDLCYAGIGVLCEAFGIDTPTVPSSGLESGGEKVERILSLCRVLGATEYLNGDAGRGYLSEDIFRKAGISLIFQEYRHPQYDQRFPGFVPYLSAVDLLFNCGEKSGAILRQGGEVFEVPVPPGN